MIELDKIVLPVYQPYLTDYHTRINVFYGGAGSGKSHFLAQKLILKCRILPRRKLLVIRKVGATLRDSVWASFLDVLSSLEISKTINKADYTITLDNGSQILFKGLDDKEKLKSIQGITDVFIEEATELTIDDYTQLNLRLRSKEPYNQIHLAFNPISKANWCYKYFFEGELPKDCIVVKTTYLDNPHLPDEYISSILELEKRNPTYFKIYVQGEFATLDKLIFPIFEKRRIDNSELEDAYFWCGMDFGYVNDPTAITWGYYKPEERILFITGEHTEKGLTNDKIAERLQGLGLIKEIIVADSAEPKSIAELRKMGVKRIRESVKGADSIINGIDKIQRCKIIIDESCTDTIEEFENYTWEKDKKTGEYINKPIDTFNHHIDSIRYGIQPVISKRSNKGTQVDSYFL